MDFLDVDSDVVMRHDDFAYKEFLVCEDSGEYKQNVPLVSESSDIGDKENSVVKQPHTKKEQFQKMIDFANSKNIILWILCKSTLNDLWEKMTIELNGIGPPIRTVIQWRRVWSVYKYNTKRSQLSTHEDSSQATGVLSENRSRTSGRGNRRFLSKARSSLDQASVPEIYQSRTDPDNTSLQEIPIVDRVLVQLELMGQRHDKMIQNQEVIMTKIDISNQLLAAIAGITLEQPFQTDE